MNNRLILKLCKEISKELGIPIKDIAISACLSGTFPKWQVYVFGIGSFVDNEPVGALRKLLKVINRKCQ